MITEWAILFTDFKGSKWKCIKELNIGLKMQEGIQQE